MIGNETVRLVHFYGKLQPSIDYRVVGHGRDYVTVKASGGNVNVPLHMIDDGRHRRREEEIDEEDLDYLSDNSEGKY